MFGSAAEVSFRKLSSNLIINGVHFKLVGNVAGLAAAVATDPAGNYALAKNYDATTDGPYKKPPIQYPFSGTFEGLGHVISHLSVAGDVKVGGRFSGFFAVIAAGGTVRHLSLLQGSVVNGSNKTALGLLAGENLGKILAVVVSGTVQANNEHAIAGGLVGLNASNGSIAGSAAKGVQVSATALFSVGGGLVGTNYGGILDSGASGSVVGDFAGGLVGYNYGDIDRSYADVTGNPGSGLDGGLVAVNDGRIGYSYSLGQVYGHFAGGLAGENDNAGAIAQSYSVGQVTGGDEPGGFVGDQVSSGKQLADNYWDVDTSGVSQGCGIGDCSGVSGLTDVQLKSGLPNGFDPQFWAINPNINHGYPYLLANPPR